MHPLETASSRRKNDTSCGARPGAVGDEALICEIRIVRPVSVANTRRCTRYFEPVNLSAGLLEDVVIFATTGMPILRLRMRT